MSTSVSSSDVRRPGWLARFLAWMSKVDDGPYGFVEFITDDEVYVQPYNIQVPDISGFGGQSIVRANVICCDRSLFPPGAQMGDQVYITPSGEYKLEPLATSA